MDNSFPRRHSLLNENFVNTFLGATVGKTTDTKKQYSCYYYYYFSCLDITTRLPEPLAEDTIYFGYNRETNFKLTRKFSPCWINYISKLVRKKDISDLTSTKPCMLLHYPASKMCPLLQQRHEGYGGNQPFLIGHKAFFTGGNSCLVL